MPTPAARPAVEAGEPASRRLIGPSRRHPRGACMGMSRSASRERTLVDGAQPTAVAEQRDGMNVRRSPMRYQRLFETAHDGILILDASTGRILDANPFMTNLLGLSHDELL